MSENHLSRITHDNISVTYSHDADGLLYTSSFSRSYGTVHPAFVAQSILATLGAAYTAARPCTERVSFSLFADVQPILTDPEDGEAMRIDDVKSVNLSEAIDGEIPIGNPGRRSYICTERGNRSLEHLIALARAHLMKRARVVEITFAPKLARMPEISLRKNAFLIEPRVGEALGKIIGYSIALDGSDGRVDCQVKIGCTIGRGGSAAAAGGEPTYCSIDYVGADYQVFTGRVVLFDSSVGYQPPEANPNDDGLNFLPSGLTGNIFEEGFSKSTIPPTVAEIEVPDPDAQKPGTTRITFKLKSMTREFSSDYEIQLTDLHIPTGYDLETV
jgi:hypothetical protein